MCRQVLTFAKWLIRSLVAFLLLAGLGLATAPWWAPAAFERWMPGKLESLGFSVAAVTLEQIGWSESNFGVERLQFEGVAVADAEFMLGYTLKNLRRGVLEKVVVAHPEIDIDFSSGLPLKLDSEKATEPIELPEELPVKNFTLADAAVRLRGSDWSRNFKIDAQFATNDRLKANATLSGEGIQLNAETDLQWPNITGRATASARVKTVPEWTEFAQNRGWLPPPEELSFSMQSIKISGAADLAEGEPQNWNAEAATTKVSAAMEAYRMATDQLTIKLIGDAAQVEAVDAQLDRGSADYGDLSLAFDQFQVSTNGPGEIGLRLSKWGVSGKTALASLGSVSGSAGDASLFVEGNWQAWPRDFSPTHLSARLHIDEGPLSLFTGLGSATGTVRMDASISAGETRQLTLSADLKDAYVSASGVSLESAHLQTSVEGALPDSLKATFGVNKGRLSWSDNAGLLTGLSGDLEFSSLRPVKTNGKQTLVFDSIQQGAFTAGSGQMRFSYDEDRKDTSPLELEFTAPALGGNIRIVVNGRIDKSKSLAIRLYLDHVELKQVAALFPQFDGSIEGKASGEMALRLEENRIILEPGSLQLAPNSTGRFEYLRQGWLTQKPDLNPDTFVKGRDIVSIMKDPQGAPAITELAMRDLTMSEFRLDILFQKTGNQRALARIKGHGSVKGIKVPVILDVPISGDLKETINAVLKFNSRM